MISGNKIAVEYFKLVGKMLNSNIEFRTIENFNFEEPAFVLKDSTDVRVFLLTELGATIMPDAEKKYYFDNLIRNKTINQVFTLKDMTFDLTYLSFEEYSKRVQVYNEFVQKCRQEDRAVDFGSPIPKWVG